MEHQFDKDDFEHYLKDTVDEFRMYPSKRVWTSLYNNLHPAKKWPSLAISLLLISSMVYIGYSHKNEISGQSTIASKEVSVGQQIPTAKLAAIPGATSKSKSLTTGDANMPEQQQTRVITLNVSSPSNQSSLNENGIRESLDETQNSLLAMAAGGSKREADKFSNRRSTVGTATFVVNNSSADADDIIDETGEEQVLTLNKISDVNTKQDEQFIGLTRSTELIDKPKRSKLIRPIIAPVSYLANRKTETRDIEWMEDFAFHNQPGASLKSRLQYEWYITPSVGFRTYEKNINYTLPARSTILGVEENSTLQHHAALNLEAGYSLVQQHTKRVRLKGGVQVNYTNYKISAHHQGHSSTTTLLLNDPYSGGFELKQKSSTIANRAGEASEDILNNSTFQLSLPIGADVKIAGKQKIQWYVGATVQPSYTLFGNAYLVSADMKNYVYDANYLRKFNLNGGLETFVSYKMPNGVTLKAGPQVRYQLFSTYKKEYSYTEHLYNVGVKLGMVRNF